MFSRKRLETSPEVIGSGGPKRSRRCLTIEDKIKLLNRLKAGERPMELSRECEISDSTVRSLMNNETQLRKYAEQCTENTYQSVAYIPRDEVLEKMEKELYAWYEKERQHGGAETMVSICAKARYMYAQLQEQKQETNTKNIDDESNGLGFEPREFKASKSWFLKFRKRYNLEFRSIYESEPVDPTAANIYPATFAKLVQTGGYQPCQVFTAVEFSFAWKRMPSCTSIAQTDKSRDRIGYDRISLLLCNNANGDLYIKPMLIHKTRTPYCLRTSNTSDLPVFWRWREGRTQSFPRVTAAHLHDWLTQCFTPTTRKYLQAMKMPKRCLLLLGSEMQQMVFPAYDDSFLRVEFLPPNTSPLLHPLTQSVLPIFQSKYLRKYFEHLLYSVEVNTGANLYKAWQKYTIAEAIDIIHESLEDISSSCWKCGWHRLWPEIVSDSYCKSQLTHEITGIAVIGNQLPGEGFGDMTIEDIKKYLKLEDSMACDRKYEHEDARNPVSVDKIEKSSVQNLDMSKTIDLNENENDELISLCSEQDLHWDEANDVLNNAKEARNHQGNEILIQIEGTEDESSVSEIAMSEDEAVFEFHQTENFILDENSMTNAKKVPMQIANRQALGQVKTRAQLQIINKAFNLSRELLETLRQLETHANLSTFANGLDILMQPYVELKKQLLQPSIKDYFSK